MAARKARSYIFTGLGILSILVALGVLVTLILDVLVRGLPWLDWQFLSSFDSRFAERAGIKAAIFGTAYMMFFTILLSLPLGVMSAIYLEEYSTDSRLNRFIELNISNLAGVPSIIYGLLGLQVFVRWFGLERSVLAGSFTMALLVMPTIIVAAREAIRAVPSSIRDASYALGATRWQTVWHHVLPNAFGGILTGNILAASRAIGETAPLITIGALTFVLFTPDNPMDTFTVLPIVLFNWVSKPQSEFHDIAAAGIVVLLLVLLTMNSVAIILRARLRQRR
ncbi:MAG: phosphate ABC transporter permease PstA [Chloroflexota bacterium]|nr:phosphate ABC transporter permease PstA [Chloroflexota bacterium]MDQ5866443.1 phosphate ABC transporter permease PstA [Chloroflexota bacterium]